MQRSDDAGDDASSHWASADASANAGKKTGFVKENQMKCNFSC
jgi:hypothetical protein